MMGTDPCALETLAAAGQVVRTQRQVEQLLGEAVVSSGLRSGPVRKLAALVNAGDLDAAEAAMARLQDGEWGQVG